MTATPSAAHDWWDAYADPRADAERERGYEDARDGAPMDADPSGPYAEGYAAFLAEPAPVAEPA